MKKYLAVEHVKWLSSLVSITVHTVSCITSLILKENIVLGSTIALYLDTPMTTILQPCITFCLDATLSYGGPVDYFI